MSNTGKLRTKKTPNTDSFHAVLFCRIDQLYTAASDTQQTIDKFSEINLGKLGGS